MTREVLQKEADLSEIVQLVGKVPIVVVTADLEAPAEPTA